MNKELLKAFNAMFSRMTKEVLETAPCRIEVADFINKLKNTSTGSATDKNIVTLDIRTKEEMAFMKFTYGEVLNIEMKDLFTEENISKLDFSKEYIILCRSGARAIAISTTLSLLGFKAIALKGGWGELSAYLGVKTV